MIRNGKVEGVPKDIPIVAMTAHALQGDADRFLSAGMNDYLPKPLNASDFQYIIERAINGQTPVPLDPPREQRDAPPVLDLEAALARTGGDMSILREIWQAYVDEMPRYLSLLKRLRSSEQSPPQSDAMGDLLHEVLCSASDIGAQALVSLLDEWQERPPTSETADARLGELESLMMQTVAAVTSHL